MRSIDRALVLTTTLAVAAVLVPSGVHAGSSPQLKSERLTLAASAGKPADFMTVRSGAATTAVESPDASVLKFGRAPVAGTQSVAAVNAIQNVAICGAPFDQFAPTAIADGDGGTILVWSDYRSGNLDIFAQRLDEAGYQRWAVDGVPVCKSAGNQTSPKVVPDGAGGAYVVWMDDRNGTNDIYAQRIGVTGSTVWDNAGVLVCGAANEQRQPQLVSAGLGGLVVVWVDERGVDADVYAQKISPSGIPQWTANGIPLCVATGIQDQPSVIGDGAGGALAFWIDNRGSSPDLFAARVNDLGVTPWAVNGVAVCATTGAPASPSVALDGANGAVVAWTDSRGANLDIYAQHLNSAGTAQWTANGVLLCGAAGDQTNPRVCADGAGGAVVAWEDRRGANADIYAGRLNDLGAPQWAADGVAICSATADQTQPNIAADPTGGAAIVWSDARAGDRNIYVQRVQLNGSPAWTANGVAVCDTSGDQDMPVVVSDASGGAFTAWRDYRSGANSDLFGQRVNSGGQIPAQCVNLVSLAPNTPIATTTGQHFYSFNQIDFYWAAVGVRSPAGTDYDLEVYEPNTLGLSPYPVCFLDPYAGSYLGSAVDLVVGNFNPGRTPVSVMIGGEYGVRVTRYTGAANATVEWDADINIMAKDCTGGSCGARSGNNWTGVVDIYDLYLVGGQLYTFDFTKTGGDMRFMVFAQEGAGPYIVPRSARVVESNSRFTGYVAPVTGFYGVAIVNENGVAGTYVLKAFTGTPTGIGPGGSITEGLQGVFPNPSRGDSRIQFVLPRPSDVSFRIVDLSGRVVGSVPKRRWDAGTWTQVWNGVGTSGRALPPGVYMVEMSIDGRRAGTSRLALVR